MRGATPQRVTVTIHPAPSPDGGAGKLTGKTAQGRKAARPLHPRVHQPPTRVLTEVFRIRLVVPVGRRATHSNQADPRGGLDPHSLDGRQNISIAACRPVSVA